MYRSLRRLAKNVDIAPVRDFGSWWHAVRAAYLIEKGNSEGSLISVPDRIEVMREGPFLPNDSTVDDVLAAAAHWYQENLDDGQRAYWEDTFKATLADGLSSLLSRWTQRWAVDFAHERVLAVEMGWQRWLESDGQRALLEGTVDEIIYDPRRRMTIVRDGKTSKDLSGKSALDDMMDSQLMLYAWGVAPAIRGWGVPKIRVVSYDRCRSITPTPPALTKSGRLAIRGGEPSISNTDLDTYLEWAKGPDGAGVYYPGLKKDGSGEGFYVAEDNVIAKLSSPASANIWFTRTRTPLNPNMVRTHLRAALDSAADIDQTIARVAKYGYAQRNLTSGCSYCVFAELCRAEMIGGAGEYELADYGLRKRLD